MLFQPVLWQCGGSARRSTETCCLDIWRVFLLGKGMTHGEIRVVITTF